MKILFLLCERSVKLENEITPTSVDGNDNFSDIKRDPRPAFEEQDILVSEWLWTMSETLCWVAKVSVVLLVVCRLPRR